MGLKQILVFDRDSMLKFGLGALIFLCILIISKELILFSAASIITFLFNYFQNRFRLPFDISPMVFFSALIAIKFNLAMMVLFMLISGILPSIIAGGEIGFNTIVFFAHMILLNALFTYLNLSVQVMTLLYPLALGAAMFSVTTLGNQEAFKRITVPAIAFVVNIAYFLNLGLIFRFF